MQEASAAEYHSKDFDWEELRRKVESDPSLAYHRPISSSFSSPSSCSSSSSSSSGVVSRSLSPASDSQAWSHFHSRHFSGKFFKERRYLLKEFPELVSRDEFSKVLEVGCGNGSTILPILRANKKIDVYTCDCSVEALERAKENLENAALIEVMDRFHPFCCDFSATQFPKWLACDSCRNPCSEQLLHCSPEIIENGSVNTSSLSVKESRCCLGGVDFVTLIFTLSAVPPERMPTAIKECFSVLKPGGHLFFRDYGLYDMSMLRFEPDKKVSSKHYMRGDGTYSYFFDLDDVRDLFVGAGFTELELEYCCVKSVNRQKGKSMRRVWVHGKFQKPL